MFSSEKYLEICNNVNVSKGFNSCEIGPEYSVAEIFYNSNDTLVICIAHVKWCLHDTIRLDNRLDECLHDAAGCTTSITVTAWRIHAA